MKVDELPLLLKPSRVTEITGLTNHRLRELVKLGELEVKNVRGSTNPLYTRDSLKKYLNLNGQELLS